MNIITIVMVAVVLIMVGYPSVEGLFLPKAENVTWYAAPGYHNGTVKYIK